MVKFLKFILFLVVIAFSFALGVKFSDYFKGNILTMNNEDTLYNVEMNKNPENANSEAFNPVNTETQPLTDSEISDVNSVSNEPVTIEYIDVELVEPMDNVPVTPTETTTTEPTQPATLQTPTEPIPTEPDHVVPTQATQTDNPAPTPAVQTQQPATKTPSKPQKQANTTITKKPTTSVKK